MTNGDKPHSQFLDRLTSYPAVSDAVDTVKGNAVGQKGLELTDAAYQRFGKPVLPYLQTPYSYAAPYLAKADSLADSGLGTVENHFPIVKEDTNTIVDQVKGTTLYYPFKLTGQTKDYLLNTWSDEYKKTSEHGDRGPGLTTSVLALISTELRFASDAYQTVVNYLGPKKEEAQNNAQDAYQKMSAMGQEKMSQAQQFGQTKMNQANDLVNQAQSKGQEKADEAKKTGQQAQQKAQEKAQK